jgi:hypothetical protein
MTMPCLVYAGDADRNYPIVEATVAEMPNVKFITLPGCGHADAFLRSELMLPRVIEFLGAVTPEPITVLQTGSPRVLVTVDTLHPAFGDGLNISRICYATFAAKTLA